MSYQLPLRCPRREMCTACNCLSRFIAAATALHWRIKSLRRVIEVCGVCARFRRHLQRQLCSPLSASSFLPSPFLPSFHQIIEREPTIIEDYDPYKIDVGFYSPYDSRLSLNRNYHPTAIGGSFAGSGGNDSGEHFFSSSHTAANNNHHHHSQTNHGHQNNSHHHNHRQQSPATATGASNGVTVSHHQPTNHHHQHMLLSSYSPVAESSSAQQQHQPPPANRPTVAAVRQVANPARGTGQQKQHLTSRHRQQVPANAATHQQNQPPFDSHSPRSIRSQEFY